METKKIILIFLIANLFTLKCFAQTDTIYTNNEKISCSVKQVTSDAINFVYPGEEMINSIYKNTVEKIVFKSGRIQIFAEATNYKTVKGVDDFENVSLTSIETEIKGLFKLGDLSSKAKGTTTMSSMEKVKERAIYKLKVTAAMMGANIIYLNQNTTTGNQVGTKYQAGKSTETNLAGYAYSNKLPNYDDFEKSINNKVVFKSIEQTKMSQRDSDFDKWETLDNVYIIKIYKESGLIMVKAQIEGVKFDTFRVISFTNEHFTLVYKDGERIYNYKISR